MDKCKTELSDVANATLDRIAAALGCSKEAFDGRTLSELNQSLELWNLWFAINDPQDRAKALSLLRNAKTKAQVLDGVKTQRSG